MTVPFAVFAALAVLVLAQTGLLLILFFRKGADPAAPVSALGQQMGAQTERMEKGLRDEIARSREEQGRVGRELREEVGAAMKSQADSSLKQIEVLGQLTRSIEQKMTAIQDSNARKLEEMRQTVDEKLQGTLEKRLGDSFKIVSERLEQVHKGLGEMQTLALGVGDLKRVLTNVKTRGIWGEIQLRAILEQIMLPAQFEANVKIRPHRDELVEFAVRLPGQDAEDKPVWLPIDSKFPKEDYERILDAQERADADGVKASREALAKALKTFARDIRDLYIHPPLSTDFAILFLPTEGLFAEVCQYPGLLETIQRDYRVTVAGPTTLATLLNSLQIGFQTLAVQKRSSEIGKVLGAVKTEFGNFGKLLDGVEKKLDEAKNKIADVRSKTRNISGKLRKVEEAPVEGASLLASPTPALAEPDESEEDAEV